MCVQNFNRTAVIFQKIHVSENMSNRRLSQRHARIEAVLGVPSPRTERVNLKGSFTAMIG